MFSSVYFRIFSFLGKKTRHRAIHAAPEDGGGAALWPPRTIYRSRPCAEKEPVPCACAAFIRAVVQAASVRRPMRAAGRRSRPAPWLCRACVPRARLVLTNQRQDTTHLPALSRVRRRVYQELANDGKRRRAVLTNAAGAAIMDCAVFQGEMAEGFKALVLKTSDVARHRGFESLSLRQFGLHGEVPKRPKGLPC